MTAAPIIPITGRRLTLPDGPIFRLQRAGEARHELGEFRAWAGYKNLGADKATQGMADFQHVISFAGTDLAGRTGIHAHFAHVHIVIPTSGRGVFSYDGIVTEAVPGGVIVQHGGTVHDQFEYSYAPAGEAETRATPVQLEPPPAGSPAQSFSFLELFVPEKIANVEIVPPAEVTDELQASAWDHPYHAASARFALQAPGDADAAWRPVAGRDDLEARDCGTWGGSGALVATWFIRPAQGKAGGAPLRLSMTGERGGVEILFMAQGSARFMRAYGADFRLQAGDALTCSQGLVGEPFEASGDMRLVRFFISARAQQLRERTAEEIARLEALGPAIITRREVRPAGDARPVNFLHGEASAATAAE